MAISIIKDSVGCGFVEQVTGIMLGALLLFAGLTIGAIVALIVDRNIQKQWAESETIALASLPSLYTDNRNGTGENFFLGLNENRSGNASYYFFYKKIGGKYIQEKIAAGEDVTILEENRGDAELKIYTSRFTNPSDRWLVLSAPRPRYEFRIPKGGFLRVPLPPDKIVMPK